MLFPGIIFLNLKAKGLCMDFIKRYFKQYRLYILIAVPLLIALIVTAIIVASDKDNYGSESTQPSDTSSNQYSYTDSLSSTSESTDISTEPGSSVLEPAFPITLGKPYKINISESRDARLLLEGIIEVPSFENPNRSPVVDAINKFVLEIGNALKELALKRPLDLAKMELSHGGDDLPFRYNINYSIEQSSSTVLSILLSYDVYTGDEHEYISNFCINYDLSTGKKLELKQIFNCDKTVYLPRIHSYIKEQIELERDIYYEDLGLVERNIFETNDVGIFLDLWCFSPDGLVLVYNPYKIADFSAGIIKFTMPYSKLSDIMKINPLYVN